jgi:hypothetical protein
MCVSVARNFQHSARCNLFLHFTINAPKNNPQKKNDCQVNQNKRITPFFL